MLSRSITFTVAATIIFVCASAGEIPVPDGYSTSDLLKYVEPIHKQKTLTTLIAELKGLEIWRHNELRKVIEDPELAGNTRIARYLAALIEYDKLWFVYAVRLLDSVDVVDHPDGKSLDEIQQATDTIYDFNYNQRAIQKSISEIRARIDEERGEVPDELLKTRQIEAVRTAFKITHLKLLEAFEVMEAQKSHSKSPSSTNYIGSQLFRVL